LKKAQFSIKHKWDMRTGSPRKLWRTLHDFLDDNGYVHEYKELRPEESPIEGTAIFSAEMDGCRDIERKPRLWLWIIGLLLCFTILFIVVGIKLIKTSSRMLRTRIRIEIEGEAYRARGADMSGSHAAEVLDVVADTRVTLEAGAGRPKRKESGSEYGSCEIEELTRDKNDMNMLEIEFEQLKRRLDELLPEVSLPNIKSLE
jgi:hypothetical protein